MMTHSRRTFLKTAVAAMTAVPAVAAAQAVPATPAAGFGPKPPITGGAAARAYWIALAEKLSSPVLENLAARTLKEKMPIEAQNPKSRAGATHLEAFGRLMCGIAPWLECDKPEKWLTLAHAAIDAATDPQSPDFLNFSRGTQPLVDTAFLAEAFLRAPKTLWEALDARVKGNVIAAMKSSRKIKPYENNWLLFAATVEAFLHSVGEEIDRSCVDKAIRKHAEWYKGDGAYGDGPNFHWDYYNSFVIHPMLVDCSLVFGKDPEWQELFKPVMGRSSRYAAILERFISPEGTYPVIGRSMAYRFGALQSLAQMALLKKLPKGVSPEQVRCALTAVFQRQSEAPGTFDAEGWLQLGFCGHQKRIADSYISTGSLYLCSTALLPLGLPASDPFWSAPDAPWTSVKAWSGMDISADHAIR